MKRIVYIRYLLLLLLFLFVFMIYYHADEVLDLTDQKGFHKNVQEIVRFCEENWEDIEFLEQYPENPMRIHYRIYDANGNFLAASSRDIRYNLDYKEYEIQIDGQRKGEVRIYYESYFLTLYNRINKHQIAIQKISIYCFAFLMVFGLMEFYKRRE